MSEMQLEDKQRLILSAMDSLPNVSPLARIGTTAGTEGLTMADMEPLIAAGLVATVTAPLPPTTRFRLTTAGRDEAARIREARHPAIYTPEMAAGPPTDALRDRLPRETLAQALAEGRSVAWMSFKFDATIAGLRDLFTEYGLDPDAAPPVTTQAQEVQRVMPTLTDDQKTVWDDDRAMVALAEGIAQEGKHAYQTMAEQFGTKVKTISNRLHRARKHLRGQGVELRPLRAHHRPAVTDAAVTQRISELEAQTQQVPFLRIQVGALTGRNEELMDQLGTSNGLLARANADIKGLMAENEQLQAERAYLIRTIETAAQAAAIQTSVTYLCVEGRGATVYPHYATPDQVLEEGDEWPQQVIASAVGRRRYDMWHCTEKLTLPDGHVICIMRPGFAETAEGVA